MNRWTVHVKNFGKIEDASVEVAPLTLFVGDNNSGKSYMMTLIYGLFGVDFFFEKYNFDESTIAYQRCCEYVDKLVRTEHIEFYDLEGNDLEAFQELLNEVLKNNSDVFLRKLFNREMEIESLQISFPSNLKLEFRITREPETEEHPESVTIALTEKHKSIVSGYGSDVYKFQNDGNGHRFFISYIMQSMLRGEMGSAKFKQRIYFPTARTGFMLTYKSLVGTAMQDKFTLDETEKNLLTRPTSDFLRELSSMNTMRTRERFQTVLDFIENNLIVGHINVSDTPTQDFVYTPEGTTQELPLYVTSGVVTELTPFLLFLKYTNPGAFLIEEPEISLHPQLQWQMARVLIRLSNMGLPVFVTTYSDLILQHVNNMIKASKMKNKEAFLQDSDYEEEDLLDRDNIRVYQFDVQENHRTKIQQLPCGDYGFEAMTFYDTLKKMSDEIDQIEAEE